MNPALPGTMTQSQSLQCNIKKASFVDLRRNTESVSVFFTNSLRKERPVYANFGNHCQNEALHVEHMVGFPEDFPVFIEADGKTQYGLGGFFRFVGITLLRQTAGKRG